MQDDMKVQAASMASAAEQDIASKQAELERKAKALAEAEEK